MSDAWVLGQFESRADGNGLVMVATKGAQASCPICRRGRPLNVIGEFATVWVTAQATAPLPGYACVVAKRHVIEPFHLPADEMLAFWSESMSIAEALDQLVRPVKMNYEIHGNTIPHLHLHLFPRFRGDPFEGRPIDGRRMSFERTAEELDRIRTAIASRRSSMTPGSKHDLEGPRREPESKRPTTDAQASPLGSASSAMNASKARSRSQPC
jgi:diadenosine tetraphosphate (Ap4A) HIT family hydrolase